MMKRFFRRKRRGKVPQNNIKVEPAQRADPSAEGRQPATSPETHAPAKGRCRAITRIRAFFSTVRLFFRRRHTNNGLDVKDVSLAINNEPLAPAFKMPSPLAHSAASGCIKKPISLAPATSASCSKKSSSSASSSSLNKRRQRSLAADKSSPSAPTPTTSSIKKKCGLSLDSFTFHHFLGKGSYGKVVLASHPACDQQLAVKFVKKSCLLQSDLLEAQTERKVLEMTRHSPFISHMYGSFQTEGHLMFVMEYLSGGDLEYLISSEAPLDMDTLRVLTAEMICGLQYLHSKGIIHRDIKPQNILRSSTGHAKIADFGLAVTGIFESDKISGGAGTPLYMAPEIYRRKPYDRMADYFSLGVTIFEMAVGRHPFDPGHMTRAMLKEAIITADPDFPPDMNEDLLNLLKILLHKCQEWRRLLALNIKKHPFFNGINWEEVESGTLPPIIYSAPRLKTPLRRRLDVAAIMSEEEPGSISPEMQMVFRNFSFISEKMMEAPSSSSESSSSSSSSESSSSAATPSIKADQ